MAAVDFSGAGATYLLPLPGSRQAVEMVLKGDTVLLPAETHLAAAA